MITIDEKMQRPLDQKRVDEIANGFSDLYAGTLLVSKRAQGPAHVALDGQHRLLAMGKIERTKAYCDIYNGLTSEEEAQIFIKFNDRRGKPAATTIFQYELQAGNTEARGIAQTLEKCGCRIVTPNAPYHASDVLKPIDAVGMVRLVYRSKGGASHLELVLKTLQLIWPADLRVLQANFIGGVSRVFLTYGDHPDFKVSDFIEKLSLVAVQTIIGSANFNRKAYGRSAPVQYALTLVDAYNDRKRSHKLPAEWLLYGKPKQTEPTEEYVGPGDTRTQGVHIRGLGSSESEV